MSTDLVPLIRATPSQLAKRKNAIARRGKVSETDVLSEKHATLAHVSKKTLGSPNAKSFKDRQQRKQQAKPAFYRYSDDTEVEQSEDIVYDDIEHVNVKVEPESHKGKRLDVLC